MRYPEQALAELKSEDPNYAGHGLHDPQAGRCRHDPSIRMGRRRLLNYDSLLEYLAHPVSKETEAQTTGIRRIGV